MKAVTQSRPVNSLARSAGILAGLVAVALATAARAAMPEDGFADLVVGLLVHGFRLPSLPAVAVGWGGQHASSASAILLSVWARRSQRAW